MKNVIPLPGEHGTHVKPIVLTHRKQKGGWKLLFSPQIHNYLERADKIVYLGKCREDGDMFSLHTNDGYIMIFKGALNSGVY